METIKFTTNWNKKLDNNVFTTIRLENPLKYKRGGFYKIVQQEKGRIIDRGFAEIIDISVIRLFQLKPYAAWLDTGYSLDQTKGIIFKMYPGKDWSQQNLYYMLIRKVKPEVVQGTLI